MSIQGNVQPQWAEALARREDHLSVVPSGLSWFDVVPPELVIAHPGMALAISPTESALKSSVLRLKLMGFHEGRDFEAMTADLPPHQERFLWNSAEKQAIPLLLVSARKLQSASTLAQLIRTPQFGPILVEQAHALLPQLWGPGGNPGYENMAAMLRTQWDKRPPTLAFSHPVPRRYLGNVASAFDLRIDAPHMMLPPAEKLNIEVKTCWSTHQKLQTLLRRINHAPESSSITVVVCQSAKAMQFLAPRLPVSPLYSFHQQMSEVEKELALMQLMHESRAVILTEARMLAELPLHWLMTRRLNLVFWQLPWTVESLARDVTVACHSETDSVEVLLLATQDDFRSQQQWIRNQAPSIKTDAPLHLDTFNRVRHLYRHHATCRRHQVENILTGRPAISSACGFCDACLCEKAAPISSLWRNLASRIRF